MYHIIVICDYKKTTKVFYFLSYLMRLELLNIMKTYPPVKVCIP